MMMMNQLYANTLSATATSPVTAQRLRPGLMQAAGTVPVSITPNMYGNYAGATAMSRGINPVAMTPAMGNTPANFTYTQPGLVNNTNRDGQLAFVGSLLQGLSRNQNTMQQQVGYDKIYYLC